MVLFFLREGNSKRCKILFNMNQFKYEQLFVFIFLHLLSIVDISCLRILSVLLSAHIILQRELSWLFNILYNLFCKYIVVF